MCIYLTIIFFSRAVPSLRGQDLGCLFFHWQHQFNKHYAIFTKSKSSNIKIWYYKVSQHQNKSSDNKIGHSMFQNIKINIKTLKLFLTSKYKSQYAKIVWLWQNQSVKVQTLNAVHDAQVHGLWFFRESCGIIFVLFLGKVSMDLTSSTAFWDGSLSSNLGKRKKYYHPS